MKKKLVFATDSINIKKEKNNNCECENSGLDFLIKREIEILQVFKKKGWIDLLVGFFSAIPQLK